MDYSPSNSDVRRPRRFGFSLLNSLYGTHPWILISAAGGMVIYLFTQATDSSGLAAVGAWIISFFVLTFWYVS